MTARAKHRAGIEAPPCDPCLRDKGIHRPATHDAPLPDGSWANVCRARGRPMTREELFAAGEEWAEVLRDVAAANQPKREPEFRSVRWLLGEEVGLESETADR